MRKQYCASIPTLVVLGAMVCFTSASMAIAQWQPERPIQLVVMAGEGGSGDRMARVISSIR